MKIISSGVLFEGVQEIEELINIVNTAAVKFADNGDLELGDIGCTDVAANEQAPGLKFLTEIYNDLHEALMMARRGTTRTRQR